jgi:hypothetical protein
MEPEKFWPTGTRVLLASRLSGTLGVVTGRRSENGIDFNVVKWDRGSGQGDGGYLPENLIPATKNQYLSVCAECGGWALNDYLCEECRGA